MKLTAQFRKKRSYVIIIEEVEREGSNDPSTTRLQIMLKIQNSCILPLLLEI